MASKTTLNATNLEALGARRLAELLIELSTGDAAAKKSLSIGSDLLNDDAWAVAAGGRDGRPTGPGWPPSRAQRPGRADGSPAPSCGARSPRPRAPHEAGWWGKAG